MHHDLKAMRAMLRAAQIAAAFSDWLRDDGDHLTAAADLFGGTKWKKRADAVLAAAKSGFSPTNLVDELSNLHRFLTLELTDDLDSEEAALFSAIHPNDPRVNEAWLCAETLERGLVAMAMVAAAEAENRR
ncbi:MAG: hypothetical protein P8M63_09045, partial [Paracoccaceae bacterium]|nr:hypothetical protein [Paracoccaceae bacterium]